MSHPVYIEQLIDSGRYVDALKALCIQKEAVQRDPSVETYQSLAIQNKIAEVRSKQGYYDEAFNMFSEIHKKLAEFGDGYDQEIMAVKENIGNVFVNRRDYDYALKIFEDVYKYASGNLGLDNHFTFQALRNVAILLCSVGRYDEAMIRLKQVYYYRLQFFGIDHKSTLQSVNDIAKVYLKQREYEKALWIFEKTRKYLEHKLPHDWDTLLARCNTANIHKIQHNYDEAFKIFGEVYLIQTQIKPQHPDTLNTLRNLAELFEIQGEYKTALLLLNKIYCIQSLECPMHPGTIEVEKEMASVLLKQEKFSSALHFFNAALNKISAVYGVHHGATIQIQKNVAIELYDHQVFGEALNIFLAIYDTQCEMDHLGPDHPDTLLTKIYLGRIYLSLSRFSEALKEFNYVLEILQTELGQNDVDCLVAQNNIAEIHKFQKTFDEAYEVHYDFFQTQLLTLGERHPETLKARQHLADFQDSVPKSSLVKAIIANDLNEVKFAVDIQDADVNARDVFGCTALHVSSERGNTDIVKYLLGKGAIYNVENKYGKSPMDVASNEEIKCLLKSADAMFAAVKEGNFEEVVRVVKENDSVVNSRDEDGKTPLHLACVTRAFGKVKFLLNSGAEPNMVNDNGDTPLLVITPNHYKEIIADLLRHTRKTYHDDLM